MTNFWRYVGLLLLVQWVVACSDGAPVGGTAENGAAAGNATATQAPRPAPAEDARLVLAFGDSLYAGYQLAPNEGFAPALERALQARGIPARVVNAGVSGDTSAAGLAPSPSTA
jgi:acyl-CoA thioesterase-1